MGACGPRKLVVGGSCGHVMVGFDHAVYPFLAVCLKER